ncbi:MAG TPA: mechanosensitive ion channel family protein [Burkholderiales bacterium]|nr:mechanosensitive ion channel family protein [Burkholderiales bacterium]
MDELRSFVSMFEAAEWKTFLSTASSVILILILAAIVRAIAHRLIRSFREAVQRRAEDPGRAQRIETLGKTFRYITTVVIAIVAGSLILGELGISVAPILAAAGVAGIAVGFAAQSLIKDYFHGFFFLLEDQIRQGEVVQIAGIGGVVESLTLRYVRLRDFDGHVHFVPNGEITAVTNRTRDFAQAVIRIGIAYREDVEEAFEVMREVGRELRADAALGQNLADDIEIIGVDEWGDSSVNLVARLKIVPPIQQWTMRREYLKRLKKAFDARGIEIPFPHLTVYAGELKDGSAPAFRVSGLLPQQ